MQRKADQHINSLVVLATVIAEFRNKISQALTLR